jgi:hypothetical protein
MKNSERKVGRLENKTAIFLTNSEDQKVIGSICKSRIIPRTRGEKILFCNEYSGPGIYLVYSGEILENPKSATLRKASWKKYAEKEVKEFVEAYNRCKNKEIKESTLFSKVKGIMKTLNFNCLPIEVSEKVLEGFRQINTGSSISKSTQIKIANYLANKMPKV